MGSRAGAVRTERALKKNDVLRCEVDQITCIPTRGDEAQFREGQELR